MAARGAADGPVAPAWIVPDWPAPPGVRAAFSLRTGGVSAAPCDSLNIGMHVGDDPSAVAENRRRLRASLALPSEPLWLEQVHGASVCEPELHRGEPGNPRADAIVTRALGQVCAIQVADCLPVLLATRDGTVIGAAHAGWRGLSAGVLEATLAAMRCDARGVVAWLGPAIGPASFEVGDEVLEAFVAGWPQAHAAFSPSARGRWLCDLYLLARQRLAARGVTEVHGGGWCTLCDAQRFFSFRRDGRTGRMAALLWKEQYA